MSTIYGGNSDRPQNIYTFAPITNVVTLQGSMNGVDWAGFADASEKESGNHLDTYSGYAVRYVRVVVSASHATRTLTTTICCDA